MARGNADTDLQVGDDVTILGRIDPGSEREFGMAWVEGEMDNVIGKTGRVSQCSTFHYDDCEKFMYKVDGCTTWWWIAEWLDVPDDQDFDDEAFESVFV